jgi:hypothetical protein
MEPMTFPDGYNLTDGKCCTIRVRDEVGVYRVGQKYLAVNQTDRVPLGLAVLIVRAAIYQDLALAFNREGIQITRQDHIQLVADFDGLCGDDPGPVEVLWFETQVLL